jgi:hypothetical protein
MKSTRTDAIKHRIASLEVDMEKHQDLLDIVIPYYGESTHLLTKSVDQIMSIVRYREKYNLFGECEVCKPSRSHTMTYIGDNNTDGIILFQPTLSEEIETQPIQLHIFNEMLRALRNHKKVMWVFDFNDYSAYHVANHTSVVYTLCEFIYECFFDQVSRYIILNPPMYVTPLIYLAKQLLKLNVEDRLEIIYCDDDYQSLQELGFPSRFNKYIHSTSIASPKL